MDKPEGLEWISIPVDNGTTLTYVLPNNERKIWVRWIYVEDEKEHETIGYYDKDWPQFYVSFDDRRFHGIELVTPYTERVLAWAEMKQ